MTDYDREHISNLFDKYCERHITCDNCKYFKDKRVTDTYCCNDAYAEDYNKKYNKK